jgi:hypothetical protein
MDPSYREVATLIGGRAPQGATAEGVDSSFVHVPTPPPSRYQAESELGIGFGPVSIRSTTEGDRIERGEVVEIHLVADPERLRELDPMMLG